MVQDINDYIEQADQKGREIAWKTGKLVSDYLLGHKEFTHESEYDPDHDGIDDEVSELQQAYQNWEQEKASMDQDELDRETLYQKAEETVSSSSYSRHGLYKFCKEQTFQTGDAGYFISAAVNSLDDETVELPPIDTEQPPDIDIFGREDADLVGIGYKNDKELLLEGSGGSMVGEDNRGEIYSLDVEAPDTAPWNEGWIYDRTFDDLVVARGAPSESQSVLSIVSDTYEAFKEGYRSGKQDESAEE